MSKVSKEEDTKKLFTLTDSALKSLIRALADMLRVGDVDLYSDLARVNLYINRESEKLQIDELAALNAKEKSGLISALIQFTDLMIHKKESELTPALFNVEAQYEEKIKFIYKNLIEEGASEVLDYKIHCDLPKLLVSNISGSTKLKKLTAPFHKKRHPCADVSLVINDGVRSNIIHFEADINMLKALSKHLEELISELEEMNKS